MCAWLRAKKSVFVPQLGACVVCMRVRARTCLCVYLEKGEELSGVDGGAVGKQSLADAVIIGSQPLCVLPVVL